MAKKLSKPAFYLDEYSKLLFMYIKDEDTYIPFMYEYAKETEEGKLFLDNPLYRDLFNYVMYVRRRPDKRTGQMNSIPLFVYQWSELYVMIKATIDRNSEKFLMAWSRQAGKSELIKIFSGFAVVYLPKYMDVPLERFYLVLGSYKNDAVEKLSKEVKPYIYKAIEFHNENYEDKLIYKKDDSKLIDEISNLEINKVFVGQKKSIPYSQMRAISVGTTQDGLSAHALVIDEAGLINAELFETSVSPFLTATGGCQFIFGVPNQDSLSVFVAKYNSSGVIKFVRKWEEIYRLRALTDINMALYYKKKVEGDIKERGQNSPYIQFNYYLNPNILTGRFMTEEILEAIGCMTEPIILGNSVVSDVEDMSSFIVAGYDTSIKHDYKSLVIGKTTIDETNFYSTVYNMFTFNQNETQRFSVDEIAEMCVKKCIEYKVDVFCFDCTAIGYALAQNFIRYCNEYKVVISLMPIIYNALLKSRMFQYLESQLYEGKLKLLNKSASWEAEKLYYEMLSFEKKAGKTNNYVLNYSAPRGEEFSDDHMNSLALFNIGLKELIERVNAIDKRKRIYDDGKNRFFLFLRKFEDKNKQELVATKEDLMREINEIKKINMDTWCPVL